MPDDASKRPRPDCPYVGLRTYSEDEADLFFGRDRERDLVIARLRAARLTLVYGESGVGKSSLLNAGVVHRLRQLARFNLTEYGAPQFAVASFASWQENPLVGIRRALRKAIGDVPGDESSDSLAAETESLTELLRIVTERIGGSLYVILDQFEEYFRYSTHPEARAQFADELSRAVNSPDLRANFLISIREDMLARLDRFKDRIPSLFDSVLRIDHLDREGARAAIVNPLERYGELHGEAYEIEGALIDVVLRVVGLGESSSESASERGLLRASDEPRAVAPLLQLVMERLWHEERKAGSRKLRLSTFEQRLGGARRIAETHIEERMAALSREEQAIAADVLDRLVTPSGLKIAHALPDLAKWLDRPEGELEPVLNSLCAPESRILRRAAEGQYEISHDIWGRPIQAWLTTYRLIQAGKRVRRRVGVVSVAVALVLLLAAALVVRDWRDAVTEARVIQAAEPAARSLNELDSTSGGMIRAGLLAVESLGVARTPDGVRAAQRILSVLPRFVGVGELDVGVRAMRFNPDGAKIAITTTDGTVRIWGVNGRGEIYRIVLGKVVHALSISPDGLWLAGACGDRTARVWESDTGNEVLSIPHAGAIRAVALDPDGRRLATGSDEGAVQVWDVHGGQTDPIMSAAPSVQMGELESVSRKAIRVQFNPDGSQIAATSIDNAIRAWNVATGDQVAQVEYGRAVYAFAFSSTSERLIAILEDGSVRAWNIAAKISREMLPSVEAVVAASLSQDGERAAIAGCDGTVSVWNTLTGGLLARMPHTTAVRVVSLSPDGTRLATWSDDGVVRVWETSAAESLFETPVAEGLQGGVLSPCGRWIATIDAAGEMHIRDVETGEPASVGFEETVSKVLSVAFCPEGEHVVTVGGDGSVHVWDLGSGEGFTHGVLPDASVLLAAGPSGRVLAVQSSSRTIVLWDVESGRRVQVVDCGDKTVQMAVFSMDGTKLATASSDKTARIWDVKSGEEVARFVHEKYLLAMAFSPDGRYFATTDDGNNVRVWNVRTQGAYATLPHTARVWALSFDREGRYLATASDDRTARLWDVATGGELDRILHGDVVTAVAFDDEGTKLITVSGETVWGWEMRTFDPAEELCARLPRNFTEAEWKRFFPDEPYRCTCENLPSGVPSAP